MSAQNEKPDLERLIEEFQQSGLRELHVRKDGLEIYLSQDRAANGLAGVRTEVGATPAAPTVSEQARIVSPASSKAEKAHVVPEVPEGGVVVTAPYLGTFYRSPKPGSPPYVELGQAVDADTELCLIEVMKLFTAVRAAVAGTVYSILANDGEMVAPDRPLFVLLPA